MSNPRRIAGRYIVRYNADIGDARAVTGDVVGRLGGKVYRHLPGLKGFWGELPDAAIAVLEADPRVWYIEADVELTLAGVGDTTQYGVARQLDRMDQRSLPLNGTYEYSADGTGVHLWIVDNGVDSSDPELAGRVNTSWYFTYNGENPFASCPSSPHGTLMARAAAGATQGVARKATIHSARVASNGNCADPSSGAATSAMEFIADYSPRPAVINYSITRDCYISLCGNSVDDAVRYAHGKGVTVVVSAGNGNDDQTAQNACGYSPAQVTQAITVGATDFTDAKYLYSNYGSCVDLFAAVEPLGGTSTAAALTSGVAALFLQLYPNAVPNAVANEIIGKATQGVLSGIGSGSPNRLLYSKVPALTVGIEGPNVIGPNASCTWYSQRLGGQPPFSVQWRRNSAVVSTGDSYSVFGGETSAFGFDLYVVDGVGRTAFATQSVAIDPNNSQFTCTL